VTDNHSLSTVINSTWPYEGEVAEGKLTSSAPRPHARVSVPPEVTSHGPGRWWGHPGSGRRGGWWDPALGLSGLAPWDGALHGCPHPATSILQSRSLHPASSIPRPAPLHPAPHVLHPASCTPASCSPASCTPASCTLVSCTPASCNPAPLCPASCTPEPCIPASYTSHPEFCTPASRISHPTPCTLRPTPLHLAFCISAPLHPAPLYPASFTPASYTLHPASLHPAPLHPALPALGLAALLPSVGTASVWSRGLCPACSSLRPWAVSSASAVLVGAGRQSEGSRDPTSTAQVTPCLSKPKLPIHDI